MIAFLRRRAHRLASARWGTQGQVSTEVLVIGGLTVAIIIALILTFRAELTTAITSLSCKITSAVSGETGGCDSGGAPTAGGPAGTAGATIVRQAGLAGGLVTTTGTSTPAGSTTRLSDARVARLTALLDKKPKTPAEKAEILLAVFDRIARRIEELKIKVAESHDPATTQKLKDLQALLAKLKTIDFREDYWNRSGKYAGYGFMTGTNVVLLMPDFFDIPYSSNAADKADVLDVWLGDRAALLAHEVVHMNQAWYVRDEKEPWTAAWNTLQAINGPDLEAIDSRRDVRQYGNYETPIMTDARKGSGP